MPLFYRFNDLPVCVCNLLKLDLTFLTCAIYAFRAILQAKYPPLERILKVLLTREGMVTRNSIPGCVPPLL